MDALKVIVDKKPALEALPIGGIVGVIQQDLNFLYSNTTAFENALIAAAPVRSCPVNGTFYYKLIPVFAIQDELKDQANAIKTKVNDGYATAIAAYA